MIEPTTGLKYLPKSIYKEIEDKLFRLQQGIKVKIKIDEDEYFELQKYGDLLK